MLDRWPFGSPDGFVVTDKSDRNEYAFLGLAGVGSEIGILVLDVTTPVTPEVIAKFPDSSPGYPRYLRDSSLLVSSEGQLGVYDVSSPTAPKLLSILSIPVKDIAVYDDYLFVSASGVSIVDWSDPSNLRLVSGIGNVAGPLAIWEHYLLAANGTEGLVVFDISDPAMPERVNTLTPCPSGGLFDPTIYDVAVAGDSILVAEGLCGLRRIDLSDAGNPLETGHTSRPTYSVIAQGDTVIARAPTRNTGRYRHTVIVIDEDGALHVQGDLPSEEKWHATVDVLAGDHLYMTSYSALEVIDISDPVTPVIATRLGTVTPHAIAYADERILLLGEGLWVFDVSTPTDIRKLSYTPLPSLGWGIQAIRNDIAWIRTSEGLLKIDIGPDAEARIIETSDWIGYAVAVTEDVGYRRGEDGQVRQVHLEDMVATSIGPSVNVGGPALRIQHEGGLLFVSTNDGIWLMDLTNPESPQTVGFLNGLPLALAVHGQIAYVSGVSGELGIRAIDISDPARPQYLDWHYRYGTPRFMAIEGQLLLTADANFGFRVFDISDARAPVLIWSEEAYDASRIVAAGDIAYGIARLGLLTFRFR